MHDFTPIPALIGGVLIGLAASLFLLSHGRVAGISGLYGATLKRVTTIDRLSYFAFLAGLTLVGFVARTMYPSAFAASPLVGLPIALVAGVLVGFGTQLGNGCTSGHGVCGMSRFSIRSVVATCTFMAFGAVTVFVMRHIAAAGGGQ